MKLYIVVSRHHALHPSNVHGAMYYEIGPGQCALEYIKCWHRKKLAQAYIDKQKMQDIWEVIALVPENKNRKVDARKKS